METRKPEPRKRSFSNGNAPQVIILPLEGWVTTPSHWWFM